MVAYFSESVKAMDVGRMHEKVVFDLDICCHIFALSAVSASAVTNDTVKVGLRYGSSAMFSANLENAVGSGYTFGWYDEDRSFHDLGETEETTISMTAARDDLSGFLRQLFRLLRQPHPGAVARPDRRF